ncbi:MAG: Ig-like domain-containing protein, partial [Limnoraphis robusta]
DADGTLNPASVNIVTQPSKGTAVVNNNGTITYTHTGSSEGSDSFSYRVADDDGALSTAANVNLNVTAQTPGSPQVNIWYGPNQSFGEIGEPQTWINILGNASDPDGLASVTYSLNNGPSRALSLGPDTRRLQNPGDFNVDIAFDDLDGSPADDIVRVTATDTLGNTSTQTITVDYESGNVWPESYSIDWSSVSDLQDVSQVVDGLWTIDGDTVRPVEQGYDRLLGIGDVSWDDYEITVPFTLNSLNAAPGADEAGVGVLMRWTGHTDDPIPNAQPKTGFNPYGAIAWYYKGQLEITGNRLASIAEAPFTIEDGVTYNLKARAEGQSYSFKLWKQGQAEPSSWTLQGQGKPSDPSKGSILLVAHQYDVSFGDVTITPLGSSSSNNTTLTSGSTTTTSNNQTPAANQSPVANNDDATVITGGVKVLNVLSNDSDTDGSLNLSTLAIVNQPSNGSVQVNSNGTITYTNTSGSVGSDSFTYTIKDNQGAISNPATVSVDVVEQALAFNSDDFSQVALDPQWTFIDPLSNSFYQLTGTGSENAHLELSVPAGTAHDAWNGNNAVRMMQPAVNTDFELEVKFASQPSQGFQFQGILVEQDAKNWLRFDTLHDGNELRVFAAATTNGTSQTKIDTTVNPGSANYLRVNREGNLWQLEYSADGSSWKTAGSFTQSLTTNSVGTLAGNAGNSPAFTAKVDYFFNTASPIIPEDGASFPYLVASDTQGNTNVVEGGITDSYNLVLSSQPTANVVVDVTPDEQLTTDISTVTFTPSNWNVPKSVTVTAVDDGLLEETHTGKISHTITSADPDYDGLMIPDFDVAVADNDIPIRINVGGENYTDNSGNKWLADYGFVKFDGTFTSPFGVKGTKEFPLFETERYGKAVSYEIPIANGTYDVNLNFIENVYTQAGQRVFDLRIENQLVLDDFDIWDEYRILDRIVPRTFEDVTVTDGVLNLDFLATASNGFTLAIEVLEPGGEVIAQQNGNNTLIGNDDRNDTLISVNTSANYPGQDEVDVITGKGGIDIFVLGDNVKAYYDDGLSNSQGLNDYALITDFSVGQQDIIQLHGNKANYQLAASPSGLPTGTAIFRNLSNSSELIAVVQGVTDLDLASPSFSFV